ncbi:MAG: tetratricopeptide repeat protein [Sandaracinaceae bacterium]
MSASRLEMIEKMLAAGSNEPFHHYARAMELRSLGRLDDALGAYKDVIARFPTYVPSYLMAAQLAQELERDDDAKQLATAGLERAKAAGDGHAASELEGLLNLL